MKLGVLPLGRPTFDVPYARQKLGAMLDAVRASGHDVIGADALLMDEAATGAAIDALVQAGPDQVLVLQATFTDAAMVVAAAEKLAMPLSIWAVPEPRLGGRLRLNAFCGLNLAAHALGLRGRDFGWLYADPEGDIATPLASLLAGQRRAGELGAAGIPRASNEGRAIAETLRGKRIGCIGTHPAGFDTCAYDPAALEALAGVQVDAIALNALFDTARAAPAEAVTGLRRALDGQVPNAGQVDAAQLDRSLRLKSGLDMLQETGSYDAFAIRCWPETFTEYGGAVCGPAAMKGEGRVPCACEADVYGALTQLVLQAAADAPVFLTDLVDVDTDDDTAVFWHCGQAPMSMRDPDVAATATVHTNRKQPLLFEFPLKPGRVTVMRISQAMGQPKMVLSAGTMLRRPMAFTGTSGVIRFDRPAADVLGDIVASRLEHHVAPAYGDHREVLRGVAGALNLPLLEI